MPLYDPVRRDFDTYEETSFFASLSIMSASKGFTPLDVSGIAFPYNVLLAQWDAEVQLKELCPDERVRVIEKENGDTCLAACETYDTGKCLYYIPVIPLYRLLQRPNRKDCAQLLLSVFAYLYLETSIPYYRSEDEFLYWQYEMLLEWLEESAPEWEPDDLNSKWHEIRAAQIIGDIIARKISNEHQLVYFENRLRTFSPKDPFEKECLRVARCAFELWQQYPEYTYWQHAPEWREDDDDRISMNQYISFVADGKGWLYESLSETVNHHFNEYMYTDEPTVYTLFDQPQTHAQADVLDYDKRLFSLLTDLCTLLNELP